MSNSAKSNGAVNRLMAAVVEQIKDVDIGGEKATRIEGLRTRLQDIPDEEEMALEAARFISSATDGQRTLLLLLPTLRSIALGQSPEGTGSSYIYHADD